MKKKKIPWNGLLLRLWWDVIPTEWSELTKVSKRTVANPGGGGPGGPLPPLFLDQTSEAWRAPFLPYLRVWMTAALLPTLSASPYLKIWICHWRVSVEAALWIKLLKVFFRLKQLNSLSGKKIPYHLTASDVYCFKLITVSKWDNFLTLWLSNLICCFSLTGKGLPRSDVVRVFF